MAPAMNLPSGLRAQPPRIDDIDDVVAMVNRCELHDIGETMWERADVLSDIARDGFDPERDWVGVFDEGRCVAWAFLQGPRNLWIDVAPEWRGYGIGTALRGWAVARAAEAGHERVAQIIDDRHVDVAAALRADGFTPGKTSWVLRMDHPSEPPPPELPDGVEIRAIGLPGEEMPTLRMFEDAFSEWPDREPTSLEGWRAMVTHREGFTADDLVVAVDGGTVVGGAFLIDAEEIWVDKLAVAEPYRHRGIARALLQTAFRRSFARGYAHTTVSTDSRTGALSLYERVGMRVTRALTSWERAL
jgi:GNAT superfamily N-acetyltransferase